MKKKLLEEEINAKYLNGMTIFITNLALMIIAIIIFTIGIAFIDAKNHMAGGIFLIIIGALYLFILGPIIFIGLKILKPNEALVLTLFGNYYGTLKGPGFFFVNPFVSSVNFTIPSTPAHMSLDTSQYEKKSSENRKVNYYRKISLKTLTLNNEKQKVNDELGNPIIIGIVVIWKVVNTAKAAFNVDNYIEYLSIQCDSALRDVVRTYPYDVSSINRDEIDKNEKSLRGSSKEVAEKLKSDIQSRVEIAGLEILEARITHLAYAPEIAAVMLQRQQASAIIDARQMIVEGAVGMVDMALKKLNENDIVQLDDERKAAMVSNLLVVLCGNKDAQPIVNSGSLY
jgi:regulator of protease activity HflC (stomatin/prohibitin superfamily)